MPSNQTVFVVPDAEVPTIVDPVCSICQEEFIDSATSERNEPVCRTICNHIMGHNCLTRWLEDRTSCPMCRQPLRAESCDCLRCMLVRSEQNPLNPRYLAQARRQIQQEVASQGIRTVTTDFPGGFHRLMNRIEYHVLRYEDHVLRDGMGESGQAMEEQLDYLRSDLRAYVIRCRAAGEIPGEPRDRVQVYASVIIARIDGIMANRLSMGRRIAALQGLKEWIMADWGGYELTTRPEL